MVILIHISDLHVKGPLYNEAYEENVIRYINEVNPDLVVVTGDLTDFGLIHEYRNAVNVLKKIKSRTLVVPGNHDAKNMGYVLFEKIFGERNPFIKVKDLCVHGVDSSEPDIDDGHIGRLAYDIIRSNFNKCKGFRVIALHHHLVPVPGTGRERNIPVDAGDFLKVLIELRVGLVLAGHKHVPWLWNLNGMLILHAGTATTMRLKAGIKASFNVIEINDEVRITRVYSDSLKERIIYRGELPSPSEFGSWEIEVEELPKFP